jgi:hypothetical protein
MTTLPRLPDARLDLKAAAASASVNVESNATRSWPPSTSLASSISCARFASTTKYDAPPAAPRRQKRGDRPSRVRGRTYEELAADRVEDEIDRLELILQLSAQAIDNLVRSKCTCSLERIWDAVAMTWEPRQHPSRLAN